MVSVPVIVPPLRESFLSIDTVNDVSELVLFDISVDTAVESDVIPVILLIAVESDASSLLLVDISVDIAVEREVIPVIFINAILSEAS